jgi:hypothetical protein
MMLRSSVLAVVLACAAVPLRAQDAPPPTPGLLRVAAAPDGTVLSIDSATISRQGEATYWISAVYQYGPDLARQYGFDRMVEMEAVDCAGNRERPYAKQVSRGGVIIPAEDRGTTHGEWTPVADAELPLLQAICGTLQQSFAASLPVEYELDAVETQPSLANAAEVQHSMAHEYPRALRDAGAPARWLCGCSCSPTDGSIRRRCRWSRATIASSPPQQSGLRLRCASIRRG